MTNPIPPRRAADLFAAKILAVDPAASPARVDATGSRRRIQALVAAGWPLLHIGRQWGLNPQRPEQILRQDHVYASTRSEEHTSELQSLMRISYAVFCLTKKNNNIYYTFTII